MDRVYETVREYLEQRDVSRIYRGHLLRTAKKLVAAGVTFREKSPKELAKKINVMLRSIEHSVTRANYRRVATTLLRHRYGERYRMVAEAMLVVKQKVPPPVAYTIDEVRHLLTVASGMTGEFAVSGASRSEWLTAFILTAYETGLRFQDILDLRTTNIRGTRLTVVVNKTGRFIHKTISPELSKRLAALAAGGDGTVFLWGASKKYAVLWLRKVWDAAKLPGSTKWLRRTGATLCEAEHPGSAGTFLGHSPYTRGLAERCYIDQSLLPDRCPHPPTISLRPAVLAGSVSPETVADRVARATRWQGPLDRTP